MLLPFAGYTQEKEKTDSIGVATMPEDGMIVLDLRAEADSTVGDAHFEYSPDHPEHRIIIKHLEEFLIVNIS